MVNKYARFMRNTGPARFFVPVGLILIIFGFIVLFFFNSGDYLQTEGIVTDVKEEKNADNQTEYDISFTYQVDGTEYKGTFDNLTESYKAGDTIKVFYDPQNPEKTTNSKTGLAIPLIMIGVGALALAFGVYKTVKAFKKSKELDKVGKAPPVDFANFKYAPAVKEYYCRHDGKAMKPGYILEDADRKVLYEGKMVKQAVIGARIFEFTDHTSGKVEEHEVGHTMSQTYNEEYFSAKGWFKFDKKNIWDYLHDKGLRMTTNMRSKFPNMTYEVSRDGKAFALIETSGQYVHEDEAAEHSINIPIGKYYYRVWTNSNDFETLFLTIFGISEAEQTVVE